MNEVKAAIEAVEPAHEPVGGVAGTPTPAELGEPWDRVRELALKHLDRFMSFEPKVLKGDNPEAIHDMRVASRRLQQVLDLAYPKPRPREVRWLRRRIQRCRGALGEVRNYDVLLDHVEHSLKRKHATRREAWGALQHYLLVRRSTSFPKAVRKLSKVNLAIFFVRMRDCLGRIGAAPPAGQAMHGDSAAEWPAPGPFPERLALVLGTVWKAFEEQVTLSHRDPRGPVIHSVRIAAKRLRYLLEVVHAFDVSGSAEALAWLRGLQQRLGDWHDLEVLEQAAIEMIARPEVLREQLPLVMEVEKLILRIRHNKRGFQDNYFQMTHSSRELLGLKVWVDYLLESPSAVFAKA